MAVPYAPNRPDAEQISLHVVDAGINLTRWTSYDFASDYLTPAAAFRFTVADPDLPARERDALVLGARVRLAVNDAVLCDGHIDSIEVGASRHGGSHWTIAGRERLGLAVDVVLDPTTQFKAEATLADVLKQVYAPFGWSDDSHFAIDAAANRAVKSGIRGTPMTKGGRKKDPVPLKSFRLHQLKANEREGVHEFAKRVAERHGLWIRCSEDGEQIILDTPNYTQEPSYQIHRRDAGGTNVLDGSARFDFTGQPAAIVADSFSQSDTFGHGRLKAWAANPYFGFDADGQLLPALLDIERRHPSAKRVYITTQPFTRRTINVPPRIVYLQDRESQTQAQLENFVRREMSMLMRRSLTLGYTAEGHGQIVGGRFLPWLVDTVADVQDEVAGIEERMWIAGVAYSQSRQAGTTTRLELLRLGSVAFGVQPDEALAAQKAATSARDANAVKKIVDELAYGAQLQAHLTHPEWFPDYEKLGADQRLAAQVLNPKATKK